VNVTGGVRERFHPLRAVRREMRAVRVVFANPVLRDAQVAVALIRSADGAQLVAVATYLFGHGGTVAVAAYVVVSTVAPAVGVPAVVAATGRLGHGRLLRQTGLVAATASAGMAVTVATRGPFALLIALAAVIGVAAQAWRPVANSLLPALVRAPEELMACNAASGFLDAATVVFGPLLAALLLAAGPQWAVGVTVVLLAAGALIAGRLPRVPTMPPGPDSGQRAVRAFLGTPQVALVGLLGLAQTFVRGALNVIVVAFAIGTLRLTDGAVGLLLGAVGVGGMLGLPVALGIVGRQRLYRSFGIGLVLWGLPLAFAAVAPGLAVVLVLFAIVGLGNDLVDIATFSAFPRAVPDRLLPGVLAILEVAYNIGMALGAAVAGVLLGLFGARAALLAVGAVLPLAAALAAGRLRRFDAGLEHRDREVDLLRGQPLFADLTMPILDSVATRLATVDVGTGEVIMSEGEPGDRYVLIAEGTVTISRAGRVVATLGGGDGFGEIALVRDSPRTATAVAATAVSARTLGREAFLAALGCDPRAQAAAEAVADSRT